MGIVDEFRRQPIPVVGSCTAGRVWRAWEDGVLTGLTYAHPWVTTRNVAYCPYIGTDVDASRQSSWDQPDALPDNWRNHDVSLYPHGAVNTKRHKPGSLGCACGWWMYHDLSMSASWQSVYRTRLTVVGIVHAYGAMTRGTKGYRAQYADIAAFVEPAWSRLFTPDDPQPALVWERVVDTYPHVPVYPTLRAATEAKKGTA